MLPENKKVNRDVTQGLKIWVYGKPNIGKTTFANQFPNTLMLNTDGNIKGVDSPCVSIGGENPWEDFVATIDEILKATDQLRWVQEMNNCKAQAEEIVLRDVVYQ